MDDDNKTMTAFVWVSREPDAVNWELIGSGQGTTPEEVAINAINRLEEPLRMIIFALLIFHGENKPVTSLALLEGNPDGGFVEGRWSELI